MFVAYGIFGLMSPLIGLVLVIASVHAIWRTVTLPRRTKQGAACERCKYEVADLTSFTCPECGEDLRRVGIITPAMEARRRGSLAGAILGWTFLCATFAYAGMIATVMGQLSSGAVAGGVTSWQQSITPASGAYRSLTAEYQSDGRSISSSIELVLTTSDGATHPLTLDPGTMEVLGLGGGVAAWSPETIEAWYAQVGLDVSDPAIRAEAAEVSSFVDLLVMSPSGAFSPNLVHHQIQMISAGGPAPPGRMINQGLVILGGLGVLAIVYVLGLAVIIRRRRRLLRSVGAI
ncbi:MAG TPA: hypothetical protein VFF69_11145 [Phycisphaerales bacterium]|nr:hypothetical protein [Phycisphaerales bacterium]